MTDPALERFHEALVEGLRERGPADLARPFTVAEIYQDLVPYRTHRDRLGVEMNADYEHLLLRLLAGEGGYLKLESEHALREIRSELGEVDPDTTLYREFAAVDVQIERSAIPDGAEFAPEPRGGGESATAEVTRGSAPAGATSGSPTAGATSASPTAGATSSSSTAGATSSSSTAGAAPGATSTDATPSPSADRPSPEATGGVAPRSTTGGSDRSVSFDDGACRWCRSELPARSNLRYCPHCGEDQSTFPCRSCGEGMERGWQFCISCGTEVVG
ncbi:MAG: zinc ribbon domain-containing protein [Longimicrobiales bacterium]|nr:zinc ribbon domain-containing protein [Longimicrobiales bacterium]